MPGKIVVPLDGAQFSEQIIPFVSEVAKAGNMSVTLLTVIDPSDHAVILTAGEGEVPEPAPAHPNPSGINTAGEGSGGLTGLVWVPPIGSPEDLSPAEARALDNAREAANAYLKRIERELEDAGISAETWLGFGNPDTEIVEEAIKAEGSMIAIAARSKSFWEFGILGKTTDRVIIGSPMPVIVFKPLSDSTKAVSSLPQTVLITLDGSVEAEAVLEPAREFAKSIGARLSLIHVLKSDTGRKREHAEAYLRGIKRKLGSEVRSSVVAGNAAEEIIFQADRLDQPIIAMTEHGGLSVARWLRGSTTDKVIRNAGYPVMVISARD